MITKTLNKIKTTLIVLSFGLTSSLSYAQFFLSPDELYREANEYILADEFSEALPYFLNLIEKGYDNANIHYKTGLCYLFIPGQKAKSIKYLELAVKKASRNYSGNGPDEDRAPLQSYTLLAMAYRINNQLDKCENILSSLKDSVSDDPVEITRINNELKVCEHAKELIRCKIDLDTTSLPEIINSSFSCFNPVVSDDETRIYYMEALKFYDAVMFSLNTSGNWNKPENLTPKIKSDGDYLVVDISSDGKTLLLQTDDPYSQGDIYSCSQKNGKWSKIKKLNENINTHFDETHASFANNDATLIFTSNKDGGFGGLDIYSSDLDSSGDWGPAVNLGPVINTSGDEETPFITDSGKSLYFSSQGHYNMGGYDIFISRKSDSGEWQNPQNIGYPLNTTDNDIFYYPLQNGNSGYHARYSNNISGNLNIYRYTILSIANPARYTVKGKIMPQNDKRIPFENIQISLIDKNNNDTLNTRRAGKEGSYLYKLPTGKFELDFYTGKILLDKKNINLPPYLNIDELIVNSEIDYDLALKNDNAGLKSGTLAEKSYEEQLEKDSLLKGYLIASYDTFYLKNILFGFGEYTMFKTSYTYLDELAALLMKYPEIRLKLCGYTDAIGSETYNTYLSQKRAGQVAGYLSSSQVSRKRIAIAGFGESNPVAVNTNSNGSDNPEGRRFNRRVEIILDNVPDNVDIVEENDIPEELRIKQ